MNKKIPQKSNLLARPLKLWQDNSSQEEVRLEILPLIDVIFCILTFFILAAVTFSRQQAINVDLPSASTGQPQVNEMLVVGLDQNGQIYLEQQIVTNEQLVQALKNYYLINPRGLVVLHASRETRYNEVIELLDLLRTFGGDRVALATLALDSQEPFNPILP
jgi:biopolymer transport protein ExbD